MLLNKIVDILHTRIYIAVQYSTIAEIIQPERCIWSEVRIKIFSWINS